MASTKQQSKPPVAKSKSGKSLGKPPTPVRWLTLLPVSILLVALVLRTVSLTTFGVQVDEQITKDVVTGIWNGQWSNNWKYTASAPEFRIDQYNFSSYLYADAMIAGAARQIAASLSDGGADLLFWSRLFSALAGTLAVYVFYLVARRWFGPGTAIVAMFLTAVMPLLVQDSHYARPEAFVVALTAAAYLFLVMFDSQPDRLKYLGFSAFCFGLLIACKVSLIPMAAIPMLFLVSWKDRRLLVRAVGICAGCTLLGVFVGVPDAFFHPAAYWNGVQALRHQYAGPHPPHALVDGANSVSLMARYFAETTGLLLLLSLGGAFVLARGRRFALLAAIGGPVAFYLLYFALQRTFFERNLSHVAPLMAMLAAIALTALGGFCPARIRTAASIALVVLAAAPSMWVSGKLVFVAMRTTTAQRASTYELGLMRSMRRPIDGAISLITDGQLEYMVRQAATTDHDELLRIPDYHDSFTRKHLAELERRTNWREVGYFPSVFEGLNVNTIIAYHSVSFRYLLLRAGPASR